MPLDTDVEVIAVTRRETRRGDPMWTLQTAGGDRVNVFNNMLERRPWENSGYGMWFLDMHPGQTGRWLNAPIMAALAQRGACAEVVAVQPLPRDAVPDKPARH